MDRLSYAKQENPSSTLSSSDALLLAECSKQLQLKTGIFTQLDEKIIEKTDDEEKLENAVFESADLQATLSQKIAFIAHTLETDSPRERSVTQSVTTNGHNDSEASLHRETHPSDAGSDRNPPTQDSAEMSLPSHQEPQTVQGFTARVEAPHGGHFAARLPKLEIPIFTGEPLEWQPT